MIDIENFNPDLLKIDKKSCKSIDIYYIGYITIKDSKYVNIHRVNPLYIIINKGDGSTECNCIEEKNGNRYLTFASTEKKQKGIRNVYRSLE